jgi:streptogramin lyase
MARQRRRIPATGWVERCSTSEPTSPAEKVGTGHGRGVLAVDHDGIWIAHRGSRSVARLDIHAFELNALLKLRKHPVGLVCGKDAVWCACSNGWIWRILPTGPRAEGVARIGRRARAISATTSGVWVLREGGQLIRLDESTGEVVLETRVPSGARRMIADQRALWIICRRGRTIVRVDSETGEVDLKVDLPRRAVCLSVAGQVFVGCARRFSSRHGWLFEIDPDTAALGPPIDLPGPPRAIAAGLKSLWLACASGRREGTIERLDHGAAALERWRDTDWAVSDLASVDGSLLMAMSIVSGAPDGGPGVFDGPMHGAGLAGDFGGGGGDGGGSGN